MHRKEHKRSSKPSPYFQGRSKPTKNSMLFSSSSVSSQPKPTAPLQKSNTLRSHFLRPPRFCNNSVIRQHQHTQKNVAKTVSAKRITDSTSCMKPGIKMRKEYSHLHTTAIKQRTMRNSREEESEYFNHKFGSSMGGTKPSEELHSRSGEAKRHEKEIKRLENSVNRFRQLHLNSLKKLKEAKGRRWEETIKHERSKQMYVERIRLLQRNIESNRQVLAPCGRQMEKHLLPTSLILEMSAEEKRQQDNEL